MKNQLRSIMILVDIGQHTLKTSETLINLLQLLGPGAELLSLLSQQILHPDQLTGVHCRQP